MKVPNYDFKKLEPEIQELWDSQQIHKKANAKNKDGKVFYFLDGPPYTSGKVHLGTAWNKSLKDTFIRYKRMRGFNVWDRAGYDMHGLPTEHATEKKLGISGKAEILKMGVEPFIKECQKLCVENMRVMNDDFKRLGVWMDFENAYQSIKPEFIEGVWWVVKRAHEQNRLYEGLRTMPWCPTCASAVAKHELEYKKVTDKSIFVKLKIKGTPHDYLVIWTTTPWTIPFNLGVMVNPEIEYVKCKVEGEHWWIAKALANVFVTAVAGKTLSIVEEVLGEELEGIEYEHPLADVISEYARIKKDAPKTHTVLLSSEHVDTSAGTGLVHCAPGCGPEDYEVGHRNNIPAYNTVDERGIFPEGMGEFSGLRARTDDKKFIEALRSRGAIIEQTPVEHDYAHCWRCHNPVIFRTTVQWFFKVEDLKPQMMEFQNKIGWAGEAGRSAFDSWLRNLRDNSITKQRFWGTPLPVWKCQHCGKYDVIGSKAELESKSKATLTDLHKPWIDEVTIPCACGAEKTRIPDIMDVWLDAGTNSWTCLDFPQRDDLFNKMFPAEFICEGKDQIRGWFYVMMICGVLGFGKPSYKNVFMHGYVNDSLGRKMSKSLGNYIVPEEVIGSFGADTFRYYFIGSAPPGVDCSYNQEDVKAKFRSLGVLWNLHKYLIELAVTHGYTAADLESVKFDVKTLGSEEKYILSKCHSTVQHLTEIYDAYLLNETPGIVEELYLELSRTYIQLVREKLATGEDDEKKESAAVIYHVFRHVLTLFAPTVPFMTEAMYQNLRAVFGWNEESVHLVNWPAPDKRFIDSDIESTMSLAGRVMASILAAREKAQLTVRWPVHEVTIVTRDEALSSAVEGLSDLIKTQTNVKELLVDTKMDGVVASCRIDSGKIGLDFGPLTPKVMLAFGKADSKKVLADVEKNGFHVLKVETQEVKLTAKHLLVDRAVPPSLIEVETKGGFVYLDKTRTPELEAEGYSRELMRRIQAFRKAQDLEKRDRVKLHIKVSASLLKLFAQYEDAISEKVGAKDITVSSADPTSPYAWNSVEKIKDETFGVWMEKLV